MASIKNTSAAIKQANDIALVSHVNPDGDAIGSSLALGLTLLDLDYKVQIINSDGMPEMYEFLPKSHLMQNDFSYVPDTVISLDCSSEERIGELWQQAEKAIQVINIDHHASNTFFGDINYVDKEASATGEIVFELIELLGGRVSKDIATYLYTAIVTDTGSFQFENTTRRTHLIAADLISFGSDVNAVRFNLWESTPLEALQLLGETLKTLHLDSTGKIAWISMPYETFAAFGYNNDYIEGMVNYAKYIEGVEIGLFFKEIEPGKVKVALRSKNKVDVNLLAHEFGGGGHKRAAGCQMESSLTQAIEAVVEKARSFVGD